VEGDISVPEMLPSSLRLLTNGIGIEGKDRDAMCLLTVDADGWSHVALLSVGEVLTTSTSSLRLALWPDSTTSSNLDRTGRGVILHVADGAAHYIRLVGGRVHDLDVEGVRLACFEMQAEKVISDRVGYAEVLSGITYRLINPTEVVERWRNTLDLLQRR
jgi:hypothetical protein